MNRWLLLCWSLLFGISLAVPVCAKVDIIDLPDTPGDTYDLTWDMTLHAPLTAPLLLGIEQTKAGQGYLLRLTRTQASWEKLDHPGIPLTTAPLVLENGKTSILTLKRRPDTVALLVNHRLVMTAPAPVIEHGTLDFRSVPAGITIDTARYRVIGRIAFGDDFMRPDSMTRLLVNPNSWVEDDTWKVAYYRKDDPGTDPRDPKTHEALITPWQLSIFRQDTSTNGFWFLYRGVGPSWVIAKPTMSYPSWDQYFLETAVRTEYNSEVGIIAAYQDNNNYLLFRWKQRDYKASTAPKAELIAVVNGEKKVLASSIRGYEPAQWYRLRLNLGWRHVQALIDDQLLLEAVNPGPIEGRVGLYANGSANPQRPKVDDLTASMFVITDKETGKTINDAADALRTTSMVLFDDVRVGSWLTTPDLLAGDRYPVDRTGKWITNDGVLQSRSSGSLMTGSYGWSRYTSTARVQIPRNGTVGMYFHMNQGGNGYVWVLTPDGQQLLPVKQNVWQPAIDHDSLGLKPGEWGDLRVEADGPYVALYFNNKRVMEHYDVTRTAGRCGFSTQVPGVQLGGLSVSLTEAQRRVKVINDFFSKDRYLVTWSSAEADWYPAFTPRSYITPAGQPHAVVGAAAPLPTDQAGQYWHKGGHFHDVRVTIPVSLDTLSGQILHLAANYDGKGGYRLLLSKDKGMAAIKFQRGGEDVGEYTCKLREKSQLVFERRGAYLILTAQELDPAANVDVPIIVKETPVFAYKDADPLKVAMIGFTVTSPSLPAASVKVESDRVEDTFESAPVGWITESGIWAVMSRYSCQPQWNWFGGFGVNTPTVWSKYRLDGDQVVETYTGINMLYDNMTEDEGRRFRDICLTICSDGSHLNSGYTVIRDSRGKHITLLLRKGQVVKTTTEFGLPGKDIGHRAWFAIRMEKRGGEIKVFLDNRLALTYTDPDPLPGGYVGEWTLNNGLMIGRANLSAEKISIGNPRAAAPLAVQDPLAPSPVPQVSLNGATVYMCTFESGTDGWKERPGISARILRERVTDADHGTNTYLKVINMYPAGDFSVSALSTACNLATTPMLHLDYCFDPGAQVNLYVRKDNTWYEFLLTGKEAQEANVYTVGALRGVADGNWHHLAVNLGAEIRRAIYRQVGKDPADLLIQEIIFADWSASPDLRLYGFGSNRGGMAIRFDNFALVPVLKDAATVTWASTGSPDGWRSALDTSPMSVPMTEIATKQATLEYKPGTRFYHLQVKNADGKWGPILHLPLAGAN